eukprot:GHRR01003472.1.p1 GENE.GHRR01003472.1~~GHRR01003472.1.p1  ORF type:complete len:905 (+),score=298.55 GHRR01003472.1:335-3049(+)
MPGTILRPRPHPGLLWARGCGGLIPNVYLGRLQLVHPVLRNTLSSGGHTLEKHVQHTIGVRLRTTGVVTRFRDADHDIGITLLKDQQQTPPPPVSVPADGPSYAPIVFELGKHCKFGHCFGIVGNVPELGEWDASKAVRLEWSEGDVWRAAAHLPVNSPVSFKCIELGPSGELVSWGHDIAGDKNLEVLVQRSEEATAGYTVTIEPNMHPETDAALASADPSPPQPYITARLDIAALLVRTAPAADVATPAAPDSDIPVTQTSEVIEVPKPVDTHTDDIKITEIIKAMKVPGEVIITDNSVVGDTDVPNSSTVDQGAVPAGVAAGDQTTEDQVSMRNTEAAADWPLEDLIASPQATDVNVLVSTSASTADAAAIAEGIAAVEGSVAESLAAQSGSLAFMMTSFEANDGFTTSSGEHDNEPYKETRGQPADMVNSQPITPIPPAGGSTPSTSGLPGTEPSPINGPNVPGSGSAHVINAYGIPHPDSINSDHMINGIIATGTPAAADAPSETTVLSPTDTKLVAATVSNSTIDSSLPLGDPSRAILEVTGTGLNPLDPVHVDDPAAALPGLARGAAKQRSNNDASGSGIAGGLADEFNTSGLETMAPTSLPRYPNPTTAPADASIPALAGGRNDREGSHETMLAPAEQAKGLGIRAQGEGLENPDMTWSGDEVRLGGAMTDVPRGGPTAAADTAAAHATAPAGARDSSVADKQGSQLGRTDVPPADRAGAAAASAASLGKKIPVIPKEAKKYSAPAAAGIERVRAAVSEHNKVVQGPNIVPGAQLTAELEQFAKRGYSEATIKGMLEVSTALREAARENRTKWKECRQQATDGGDVSTGGSAGTGAACGERFAGPSSSNNIGTGTVNSGGTDGTGVDGQEGSRNDGGSSSGGKPGKWWKKILTGRL